VSVVVGLGGGLGCDMTAAVSSQRCESQWVGGHYEIWSVEKLLLSVAFQLWVSKPVTPPLLLNGRFVFPVAFSVAFP